LFAGISLDDGSTLRYDGSSNKKLYGRELSAKQNRPRRQRSGPAFWTRLVNLLNKLSPKNQSDPVS